MFPDTNEMKMYRNASHSRRALIGAIVVVMATVGAVPAMNYSPRPQDGYSAGLIPDCPGVLKNASISSSMLPLLQVTSQRLTEDGQVVTKTMPIMQAPKTIARDKYFDFKNKKTVLYAVGFLDSSWYVHSRAVGTAYSKRGYNVFISQTLAFFTQIYPKSVRLVPYIAKMFAEFLIKLTQQGLKAENLELVGISLGAHVVGMAAKHFYKATGKKPSRITGLDPAGPCFRSMPPEFRLDASDGERVDVVHTNIDGFGIAEPLGHVDFYANGGEFQPGDIPYLPCLVVCSHLKAIFYWWQAVEHPKKFIGVKCDSVQDARFANCYNNSETNYFGLKTDFNKPGIYYLPTKNEFPYFEGKDGLKEENEVYTSIIRRINSEDNFVL